MYQKRALFLTNFHITVCQLKNDVKGVESARLSNLYHGFTSFSDWGIKSLTACDFSIISQPFACDSMAIFMKLVLNMIYDYR